MSSRRCSRFRRRRADTRTTRSSASSQNLGLEGFTLDAAEIYVGVLAATILFIATNAGVIGASRITYSMATYRQLPEALRRLHPRFKTPWLSLVLFAGIAPILLILPGDVNFVGTLYSLGATLSFTIAHASLVRLRMRDGSEAEIPYRARPNIRIGAVVVAALRDPRRDRDRDLLPRPRRPEPADALGRARLDGARVSSGTSIYRRRFLHVPLRAIEKAPPALGPALALEYRNLLVPVIAGPAVRRRDGRRVPARSRAARADRRAERARGSARPSAHGSLPGARGERERASSTRRSRSATRTAFAC